MRDYRQSLSLTLHGRMILECEVRIAIQIIGRRRVLIAAGVCLTDVERLPRKSQSELCVVRVKNQKLGLCL